VRGVIVFIRAIHSGRDPSCGRKSTSADRTRLLDA
jgi:hypothetical protein